MQTKSIIHPLLACLALCVPSASAGVLFIFSEVNGDVIMTTTGSVDLSGTWHDDQLAGTQTFHLVAAYGIAAINQTTQGTNDHYRGTDLLPTNFLPFKYATSASLSDGSGWIIAHDAITIKYPDESLNNDQPDTTIWSPTLGMIFSGETLVSMGLNTYPYNTEIGLWQNPTISGADGNISFMAVHDVSAVPEPSGSLATVVLISSSLLLRRRSRISA